MHALHSTATPATGVFAEFTREDTSLVTTRIATIDVGGLINGAYSLASPQVMTGWEYGNVNALSVPIQRKSS